MQRRSFLKSILGGLGAATAVVFGYPVLRYVAPRKVSAMMQKIAIDKSELPAGAAKEIIYNDTPVIVINRRGRGYIALSRVCTHFGCLVGYDRERERLVCPCHAGVFTVDGTVVSGPPPKPLERIPLDVVGDKVYVG